MRKGIIFVLIIASVMLISACTGASLSDKYNEDEVIARAKATIEVINTLDYEAMVAEFRDDLEAQVTAQQFEDAWDVYLSEAGAFVEYKAVTAYSQVSESDNVEYAVTVIKVQYENASYIYTISMDENLEIVGMYLK